MSPDDRAAFEKAIHGTFAYYRYQPSLAGAIIFTILFSLTTLVHLFQLLRRRTWYFIPLLIGGICKNLLASPVHHYLVLQVQSC